MSSGSSDAKDSGGSRLGGARADFVASLGRKVQDARELLAALEDDPSSRPARDELRRQAARARLGRAPVALRGHGALLSRGARRARRGAKAGALRRRRSYSSPMPSTTCRPSRGARRCRARAPAVGRPGQSAGEAAGHAAHRRPGRRRRGARRGAHRGRQRCAPRAFECERTEDVDSRARAGARLRPGSRGGRRRRGPRGRAGRGAARRSADRAGADRRRGHVPRDRRGRALRGARRRQGPGQARDARADAQRRATRCSTRARGARCA